MPLELYQNKLQKIVKILSLSLLSLSTLTLGLTEIAKTTEPVLKVPVGYLDFVSLDKENKPISCDNLSMMLSDINIGVEEKTQGNHINQCQIQIKENIHKHCELYISNIEDFLANKTPNINYINGNKDICAKELSENFLNYNDSYQIIKKEQGLFIDSEKYHRKYPLPLLFIKPSTVAISPTTFNENLWQVSFDYAPSYSSSSMTQILVFSDKEKAMNLFNTLTQKKS
jgi:hypothetical protein